MFNKLINVSTDQPFFTNKLQPNENINLGIIHKI